MARSVRSVSSTTTSYSCGACRECRSHRPTRRCFGRRPARTPPVSPSRRTSFSSRPFRTSSTGNRFSFLQAYRSAGVGDNGRLLGLELFGWPTSGPLADPTNVGIAYQRFERAVFRYTAASGVAQPLLLGDYVKSELTGRDLPADLEQDLRASPLFRQYNPVAADGLHRPWDLPDSDLTAAFEPDASPPSLLLNPAGFGPGAGWPLDGDGVALLPDGYSLASQASATLNRGEAMAVSDRGSYQDFSLVVDASLTSGTPAGYGITVRQTDSGERMTLLVDASRRLATLYRAGGRSDATLWQWSPIPTLRPAPLTNRWTLRASGPRLAAWANGTPLFDLDASAPPRGSLWLAAVTWGGPTRTVFSNIRLDHARLSLVALEAAQHP